MSTIEITSRRPVRWARDRCAGRATGGGEVSSPQGSEETVAIDLGTARTQVFVPGAGIVPDEPTVTAYDPSGDIVAAGRDAWVASATGPARLRMPVRGGVVRNPVECVQALMPPRRTWHLWSPCP